MASEQEPMFSLVEILRTNRIGEEEEEEAIGTPPLDIKKSGVKFPRLYFTRLSSFLLHLLQYIKKMSLKFADFVAGGGSTNAEDDFTQVVYVVVGKEKKRFAFELELLCSKSPYFARAFGGPYIESQRGEVELEHADSIIFKLFVNWVNTGAICSPSQDETGMQDRVDRLEGVTVDQLFKLFLLADYFGVPELEELLPREIQYKVSRQPIPIEVCEQVYEETFENNKIRRVLVHLFIDSRDFDPEEFPDVPESIPAEMWDDLMSALSFFSRRKRRAYIPIVCGMSDCNHVHEAKPFCFAGCKHST